ncbi:MAG: energy transducer TonB [Kofleriaceae bacterium]|nr:energy transducer TonB [Kofleriaceae bacterium]
MRSWFVACRSASLMRTNLARSITLAILVSTVGVAAADENLPPRYVRGETIIIRGTAPPARAPAPKKNYHRMAPPYSDAAIERDVWAKAWVLLDIDTSGAVTRVKLLKKPGYDLDRIAVEHALKMRFEPAEDARGNPMATQLLWSMEWPSYWWLVDMDEPPNRVPDSAIHVPCRGSGPLHMGSLHPTYRDCSSPDLTRIDQEPWIAK